MAVMVCIGLVATMLAACDQLRPATGGALMPITASGEQLQAGGRVFTMRGVNYIHPTTAIAPCASLQFGANPNCPFVLAPIEADFDQLHALGVNSVRVFLDYYVFGGAQAADANYSMAYALDHLDQLIAAANARGIYVMPVLLAKYPQDRFAANQDATALDLHVRPTVRHLAGRPGIIAWDLFNEIDLGGPVDERCWDWDNGAFAGCLPLAEERLHFIKTIHDAVKQLDPQRLTTASLGFAKNYFRPEQADMRLADVVDVYAFHYYDDDPFNSGRYAAHWYYGQGLPADLARGIDELHALGLGKPVLITELGFPTGDGAKRSTPQLQRDVRVAFDAANRKHVAGVLLWPFQNDPKLLIGDLFTK